jgi:CRP/FNR family transcriptional regulator
MRPVEALRRVSFLKSLPEPTVEAIATAGRAQTLGKGETLFTEHQKCLGLIVVLVGAVKVYSLDTRGRELTLDREGPGESVMELPLFDGGNYPASAEAVEENTQVFVVPRIEFLRLMVDYPEIAVQGLRATAMRMRRLMKMLEAQTLHTVQARLADYLLRTAAGRDSFPLEETNEAIGSRIGTVREVVSRTLHSLKERGAIDLTGRHVHLRDLPLLARIAERAD